MALRIAYARESTEIIVSGHRRGDKIRIIGKKELLCAKIVTPLAVQVMPQ